MEVVLQKGQTSMCVCLCVFVIFQNYILYKMTKYFPTNRRGDRRVRRETYKLRGQVHQQSSSPGCTWRKPGGHQALHRSRSQNRPAAGKEIESKHTNMILKNVL